MKKVLFSATVDSHILAFHLPYLKYFKDNGYEVHVATNGTEKIPYCDVKHSVKIERSPFKLNNIKAIFALKKIIKQEKFEVIHTHTPMGGVATRISSIFYRRKNNTKIIYTAHGFHFYKGAPILNWLLYYPMEKFLARFTDILITINEEDYILAKSKFKTHVRYVPGVGLDETKFSSRMTEQEKIEFRKSLGLSKDDFVMIFPAELTKNKNQIWLIKSLEPILKRKNVHLLLAGKDSLNGLVEKTVNDLNLNDKVHILGFRKDINKLLDISNISISSSIREGLPVNIMEAMYMGLPVVATNCRGNRDLVIDGKNGYIINQNDSKHLLEVIEYLIKNYKKVEYLGKESGELVQKYLLTDVMKDMVDIYKGVR